MISNFKGKTAVLTGAASGFGLDCARMVPTLALTLVSAPFQINAPARAQGARVAAADDAEEEVEDEVDELDDEEDVDDEDEDLEEEEGEAGEEEP